MIEKIKEKIKQIINTYNKGLIYDETVNELKKVIIKLKKDNEELLKAYEQKSLKEQQEKEKPTTTITKKPSFLKGTPLIVPKRRFVSKNYDYLVPFKDQRHVFDKSRMLYELLKKNDLIGAPKTFTTVKKLMSLLKSGYIYEHDKDENWRPVTETLLTGKGDCEDISMVFVSALGMIGWTSEEVFLATGYYYPNKRSKNPNKKIGHAWTVVKVNNKWYVVEGTDKGVKPIAWDSCKEKYDACWGLFNWEFKGMISKKEDGVHYLSDD